MYTNFPLAKDFLTESRIQGFKLQFYRPNIQWNGTDTLTFEPTGRMCNLMFEYAALLGISEKNELTPRIPKWAKNMISCSQLTATIDKGKAKKKRQYEPNYLSFSPESFSVGNKYNKLKSNLQSWKYFGHIDDVIRNEFIFKGEFMEFAQEFLKRVGDNRKGDVYISVHVRRSDFLKYPNLIRPATADYFNRAINMYRRTFRTAKFIIVSDDIAWCKNNINSTLGDVFFSNENNSACQDLAVLSRCDHSILTAGSTFGYWGAYLARGQTIYFRKWLKHGAWYNLPLKEEEHFLPQWKAIDL